MARFADTFYFVALLHERDQHHHRVRDFAVTDPEHVVTTMWVPAEVANALGALPCRSAAARFLQDLEWDARVHIVPGSEDLFRRGLRLYAARPDKHWSLTDCISFVVMEQEFLQEALTRDHHFAQAGFTAVFA